MRKGFKKFMAFAAAAVLSVGALSLAACGGTTTSLDIPEGEVSSNGGFVVEKGEYYYFINGVESYTADNTYGAPVKGSLHRIKKTSVQNKVNDSEVVIPSIIYSGDNTSGIFIYGDRVYYTTPNTVGDTSGNKQEGFLDFKSATLDGNNIEDYFRLENNSTVYRYVEVEGTVYVLYLDGNDVYSYNTKTGDKTLLVDNAATTPVFNKDDVMDPYVYYTMSVREYADTDGTPVTYSYNQVYRVRADATEEKAPYKYEWDEDYVKNELGGVYPYINLGEIVLDGRSSNDPKTQFNHSETEPANPFGYNYSIQSYANGGLYFTRTRTASTNSLGEETALYYLAESDLASGWDSVAANKGEKLDVVANSVNTSKASASALFYLDEEGNHHYLYVSGSVLYRADVKTDGSGNNEKEQRIAYDVSGATLVSLDSTTHETYDYVYFTRSNGAGRSVERAVYNGDLVPGGTDEVYQNIVPEGVDKAPYEPVKVLDVQHASGWYQFELIGTDLFYADADSTVGSTSYNYISTVSLANGEGKLMDNVELAAFTKKYNEIMSADASVGLISGLSSNSNSKLSTAVKYYFYTGTTEAFVKNIQDSIEAGKKDTYLYTQAEQNAFDAFTANDEGVDAEGNVLFAKDAYMDENGEYYRTRSYFITEIGEVLEDDVTARADYWRAALQRYVEPVEEEEELPGWAWALIGIGIAFVVCACAACVLGYIVYKKRNTAEAPAPEKMAVDTTDDRSVDVYSEEVAEEAAEEPVAEPEAPVDPVEEAPAEEPEAPAEEPAPVEEAPVEEAPVEAPAAEPEAPTEPDGNTEA